MEVVSGRLGRVAWTWAAICIAWCTGVGAQVNYSVYYHETWTKVSRSDNIFSARNGHVTLQFKDKLYLIGGRSSDIQSYNLENTERNADVWYTADGASWTRALLLEGDFEVQNADVKAPGPIAPWYARYGHSVVGVDMDGDGAHDVMVLAGGYTPQPSNDVWISTDGVKWEFVHYAAWSGRAWHASAVFNGAIYIIGGTPLNNEVWVGTITRNDNYPYRVWYGRAYLNTRWSINWRNFNEVNGVPWAPRAGHKLAVQCRYSIGANDTEYIDAKVKRENWMHPEEFAPFCQMYLIGGYGGYGDDWFYHDGIRSKNDVWVTRNGVNWTVATYAAPWKPRAFHDVVVWHDPVNMTQDVTRSGRRSAPRIWLAGGGYMGMKDNNIVYIMKGYVDLWWSRDGAKWHRVDYETGSGKFLFSTDTWARTYVQGDRYYAGKWGHTLQHFRSAAVGDALFVIGGTHVGVGDMVQDVWKSSNYVICDLDGQTCGGYQRGYCGEGLTGCICNELYDGEYCTKQRVLDSATGRLVVASMQYLAVFITAAILVLW